MWLKWLPWKYMVRKFAYTQGFYDPILLLSHIRRFSQPSEVNEPIELLRAGVILHARGLINSRVIQHNLDWVWPYWVNKQFNPKSSAFIPRAFSLTHINLSNRNWTAIGLPGFADYPIVDPRGAVMPFWDSWSIDAWFFSDDGKLMAPSRMEENVTQKLNCQNNLSIVTTSENENFKLQNTARVDSLDNHNICYITLTGQSKSPAWLVISLRPYNPEGISFIHKLEFDKQENRWHINDKHNVFLSDSPDKHIMSDYNHADVALNLRTEDVRSKIVCNVGMVTAAALYRLPANRSRTVKVAVPLHNNKDNRTNHFFKNTQIKNLWPDVLQDCCKMSLPYKDYQFLFDAAVNSLILHSPHDVYPGPFTYKRFWFRDACFIIYAMLYIGLTKRAEQMIDNFLHKQTTFGYFHSQQGEWDSNGQVLWLINQFCRFTNSQPKEAWLAPIVNGAKWIINKRTLPDPGKSHSGLMPAGFSAEHLGPNDFYYWDNFWSVAGLHAAAQLVKDTKYQNKSAEFSDQATDLMTVIEKSLAACQRRLGSAAMPASPYRRLDSGMIGSIVACYPLQLLEPNDNRIKDSAKFIMNNFLVSDSFFHDISHSGVNPYLTLHLAQVLMRNCDIRFIDLVESVANFASPTGQWPEAINPRTGLGCMGDGQHIWAAAEWIIMAVNSFVMQKDQKVILCAGIFPQWLMQQKPFSFGPVSIPAGAINLNITTDLENININFKAVWHHQTPQIEIRLPGFEPVFVKPDQASVTIKRNLKA